MEKVDSGEASRANLHSRESWDRQLNVHRELIGILPLRGKEGIGVFAVWDSGGTSVFASRHLSSHMSVTTSHSNAKSSVDGTCARGIL